jgi:hypothetical protein
MKPPLPRTLSAVPQTLHARLEIAKAIRTLAGPDEDELLRRRHAEIAGVRRDLELLAADVRKTFEEAAALAKAELRAALKKYSPDQPRVPAGNSKGGQWTTGDDGETSAEAAGDEESRGAGPGSFDPRAHYASLEAGPDGKLSDAPPPGVRVAGAEEERAEDRPEGSESQETRLEYAEVSWRNTLFAVRSIDPDWKPSGESVIDPNSIEGRIAELEAWTREAQEHLARLREPEPPGGVAAESPGETPAEPAGEACYRIDIRQEDRLGGHTYERHVEKDWNYLKGRVAFEGVSAAGSFRSVDEANELINKALNDNPEAVASVVKGLRSMNSIDRNFDSSTGYEAFPIAQRGPIVMRDTDSVRVIIVRDTRSAKGFYVLTAYPQTRR